MHAACVWAQTMGCCTLADLKHQGQADCAAWNVTRFWLHCCAYEIGSAASILQGSDPLL